MLLGFSIAPIGVCEKCENITLLFAAVRVDLFFGGGSIVCAAEA